MWAPAARWNPLVAIPPAWKWRYRLERSVYGAGGYRLQRRHEHRKRRQLFIIRTTMARISPNPSRTATASPNLPVPLKSQSGAPARSSTVLEADPSARDERFESHCFRKSGSPIPHPPRFRSTPDLGSASASETTIASQFLGSGCRRRRRRAESESRPGPVEAHHAFQRSTLLVSPEHTPSSIS
jgi:hypothetical protein